MNRCPECVQGKHQNCTGWALGENDEMVACGCDHGAGLEGLARAVHEVVYAPGASFDRADPTTQTYMRECAERVAARAGLTFGASNPAQDRIEELLAWIEHTLKLPMFAHPKTDVAYEEIAHLKSWRNLLTNGLHESARETLRKERA